MNTISIPKNASICIMRLSAIGDVCHAISSVQAIQKHYPEAKITWVIGKIEQNLLQGLPGIEFIVFDKSKGISAYRDLRKSMRSKNFDVLLQMQLALRANIAAAFIPAKIKLGFSKHRSKELHSLFINRHVKIEKGFHVLDGFRDFVRMIEVPDEKPEWNIPFDTSVKEWADSKLPTEKYMVISPAASKAERDWLIERYASISDYCQELGYKVVLTGSPSEREKALANSILESSANEAINLVGKTNLQQLLITLNRAHFVLAPDSGPAHMAVTQNTPVIGLYAHSNPKRTGPYLYQDLVADAYTSKAVERFKVPSDQLDWGLRLKGPDLMQAISTEQVKQLIQQLNASN